MIDSPINNRDTPNLIIGEVYEIEAYIKFSFNGFPPRGASFVKLIGFSSKNYPVFEEDGRFFSVDPTMTSITPVRKEAA